MKSLALEAHFDTITRKPEQTPPHEILRQQALDEAMKFGIPADIATKVVNERLAVVQSLFERMREESKNTGGKLAELRSNIDADILARQVQMNHSPEEIQSQLDAIQARYRGDISSLIQETAKA
jgi:ABC-type phosphate transport system auxiliary subunit